MAQPHYSIRRFFRFLWTKPRDDPPKFQEFHLVVAALIAAVTFQACVNPPGGVWQDDKPRNETACQLAREAGWAVYALEETACQLEHEAGRAVYASDETAFYVFLAFDTLALSTSMNLLIYHTMGYPFFFEVVVAMTSMGITYGASIFAITPPGFKGGHWLLSIAAVPVIVRAAILIYKYVKWEKNTNTNDG